MSFTYYCEILQVNAGHSQSTQVCANDVEINATIVEVLTSYFLNIFSFLESV